MTGKEAEATRVRAALDQLAVALHDRNGAAVRQIMDRLIASDPAAVETIRRRLVDEHRRTN